MLLYFETDDEISLSSSTRGAINELHIAVDLMNKGFELFRALSPTTSCDLIAVAPNGKIHRVEVRATTKAGYCHIPKDKQGKFDIYATVGQINDRIIREYFDENGDRWDFSDDQAK